MIKTKKFLVEHLDQIQPRAVYNSFPWIKEQYTKLSSSPLVIMYTIFNENTPIAIVGCNHVWDGFYQAWGVLSESVTKVPISFTKEVKRLVDIHFKELKLHRMTMEVRADFCAGLRWPRAFGFSSEGVMRQWGPDKSDYVLFSRIS